MLKIRRVVKVKIETVPGTPESTGFSDLLVFSPEIIDETEMDKRETSGTYQGPNTKAIPKMPKGKFTGNVELKGNGSGGCDAALAQVLQSCGLLKTSEVYQVYSNPTNDKTLTILDNLDGMQRSNHGAMGRLVLEGTTGGFIMCKLDMPGIWTPPTKVTLPTASFGTVKPLIFANGEFKEATVAKKISRFSLDLGNVIVYVPDANAPAANGGIAYTSKTNYMPIFSCNFEGENVDVNDHHGKKLAGTEVAISIIAKSATDKVTITIPKFQRTEIKDGDLEGRAIFDTTGQCNASSGDDNVSIAFATA